MRAVLLAACTCTFLCFCKCLFWSLLLLLLLVAVSLLFELCQAIIEAAVTALGCTKSAAQPGRLLPRLKALLKAGAQDLRFVKIS